MEQDNLATDSLIIKDESYKSRLIIVLGFLLFFGLILWFISGDFLLSLGTVIALFIACFYAMNHTEPIITINHEGISYKAINFSKRFLWGHIVLIKLVTYPKGGGRLYKIEAKNGENFTVPFNNPEEARKIQILIHKNSDLKITHTSELPLWTEYKNKIWG